VKRLGVFVGALAAVAAVALAARAAVGGAGPAARPLVAPFDVVQAGQGGADAGVHGGPIERFHGAGDCALVDVSGFPGNWTHGDYVTAVARLGDPALVPEAARSDCGKPMVAVDRGGPPAHALENMARARGKAAEAREKAAEARGAPADLSGVRGSR